MINRWSSLEYDFSLIIFWQKHFSTTPQIKEEQTRRHFWKRCFSQCFLSFDFQFNKKTRERFVQPQTSKMWDSSTWTNQSTMVLEIRNPTYMFVFCKFHKAFLILAETESSFLPSKKKKKKRISTWFPLSSCFDHIVDQWMSCPIFLFFSNFFKIHCWVHL